MNLVSTLIPSLENVILLKCLNDVPQPISDNITFLLKNKHFAEESYYSKNDKSMDYSNCFGTTIAVHNDLMIKRPTFAYGYDLEEFLKDYVVVDFKDRKPGDILLMGHRYDSDNFDMVHSSTYIGEIMGEQVIFHQRKIMGKFEFTTASEKQSCYNVHQDIEIRRKK